MKHIEKLAWLLISGVVVGFAGCGDDEDDAADALEAACEKLCDATFGGSCPVAGGLDVDQCKRACPYLHEQLGGFCVSEYAEALECTVDGGFTCSENGPIPNDPCPTQNQALIECNADASCQRYCEAAMAEGCPPGGSTGACVSECNDLRAELGVCSTRYDLYLQCAPAFGLTCSGSEPTSETCDEDLLDIGACLAAQVDACEGYCFSSELLGCEDAAACQTSCESSRDADASCVEAYEDWLSCVVDDFDPQCAGGQLDASGCDYARDTYETCLMGTP